MYPNKEIQLGNYPSISPLMRKYIAGHNSEEILLDNRVVNLEIKRMLRMCREISLSGGHILVVYPSYFDKIITNLSQASKHVLFMDVKNLHHGLLTNYSYGKGLEPSKSFPNFIIFIGTSCRFSSEASKLHIPSISLSDIHDLTHHCNYAIPIKAVSAENLCFYANLILRSVH